MKRTLIALFAPLLIWQAAAFGQSQTVVLPEKQRAIAEKLIAKLERFETTLPADSVGRANQTRLREISPEIYKAASKLPESNIRTDITTAVHFYELAFNRDYQVKAERNGDSCDQEKAGAYQRLCKANSGSLGQLLQAKARLHVAWAKASLTPTQLAQSEVLKEIDSERSNDQALAERALASLKVLRNEVLVHASLADFEETQTIARVSYETFQDDLRKTSAEVGKILSWLPQNRLKFEISNALYSYQDGGLWWARVYQPRVVKVSELSNQETRSASMTAFQATVPYTVAINWRQAGRYLDRAEGLVGR